MDPASRASYCISEIHTWEKMLPALRQTALSALVVVALSGNILLSSTNKPLNVSLVFVTNVYVLVLSIMMLGLSVLMIKHQKEELAHLGYKVK